MNQENKWKPAQKKVFSAIMLMLIVVVAIIIAIPKGEKPSSQANNDTGSGIHRTQAFVIAKQFAESHLGNVDFGMGDDGFVDYGDSTFQVTGVANASNTKIIWTIELHYNGGDCAYKSNWTEQGWTQR